MGRSLGVDVTSKSTCDCHKAIDVQWWIIEPVHNLPRLGGSPLGAAVKNSISFMSRPRKAMSEWVVHCEVNQRHIRRSLPTREAALKDACSQLLQGHAVNRIVGPNKTITAEQVRDWCAKHRS